MRIKQRRRLVRYLNFPAQPVHFSPFVFSWTFLLWALQGLIGGLMAGVYWVLLRMITHQLEVFEDWLVIPVMAICGLLAGLAIHFFRDPGEIKLIVNNIRFNNGRLDPKNNPSIILSSLLCVGAGGSLGLEAPLVQVTGSTGSRQGKIFRIKGEALRSTSITGMASGFIPLFGAPQGESLLLPVLTRTNEKLIKQS